MAAAVAQPLAERLPRRTGRALPEIEDPKVIPIVRDPSKAGEDAEAVFNFPGCGSERVFSQAGLATQAVLYEIGVQCVMPPGYLGCGYAPRAASEDERSARYLYHDPCHSPMKVHRPVEVARALTGSEVALSPQCCGESGTLAVSRPDLSTEVRFRKEEVLRSGVAATRQAGKSVKVLTSCPSCLQGLARFSDDTGTQPDYIVVEMARHLLGENWLDDFVGKANAGGVERVLL